MANIGNIRDQRIADILRSNNVIKQSTLKTVLEYIELQNRFFDRTGSIFRQLDTIESVANIFINDEQKKLLNEFKPIEKVQLAIYGYNLFRKTIFVHDLLEFGNFLPTGIGAVSARIVKFSYAPASKACLIKYQSELDPDELEEKIDISSHFVDLINKANTKLLKKTVKRYAARPEINNMSDEFLKWASHLIEICIPSLVLQLGIDIYDTPGFLGEDPPIVAENILKLISSVRPSLVYLYDNAVVSDDSRKCFQQVQLALRHHFRGTGIFYLNTKGDVLTIRKDTEDDDNDDEEHLLNNERKRRYKLLLNVNEMSSTMSNGQRLPLDQCDCFDIFSSQG